ncbi:MAG: ABC transporter ATP-binding protein [Burkholderiaceae bacterium]|nr:ABC transporter ATP-binding protein [Burkholderiaceae bacterium]MCD8536282.1 ABC transporter ATP-binding protein [Burkholderiaceae bacterium]MCD8564754.1 ABC transporter ATP-binding protein [Burkholderiaceae bacterium]
MSKAQALICFKGVDKSFDGGTKALSNLNLCINAGEFVSLIGPSGCGKSTILRLVAGMDSPTIGELTFAWQQSDVPGELAYVFQEPTLMPWATVFDNVWLPLRLKGVSRAQATDAVMASLEAVGLAMFAMAYPAELSGGMKMRVSLARATVTHPTVLLLDEPFAALDESSRLRLSDDLREHWRESGVTVLMVTHSVSEAAYLSERVVVLSARPATVAEDIRIEFARAHDASLRLDPEFLAMTTRLSMRLNAVAAVTAPMNREVL